MKNLLKKLAFVMAFALVLTSLAPAASASAAASDMKINLASKILYLGGSDITNTKSEYDFSIKNKPKNYSKLYNFKWTSSNTKVATVGSAGLTKAVSTGNATITCTITDKKTGKTVAKPTTKVTVKQNAGAVSIKIKGNPDQRTATVGEVVDFDRTMTPKTGKSTATDKTKWIFTYNDAGASVTQSNGKVVATQAGTYTIMAYTYQSATNGLKYLGNGEYSNYTSFSNPVTITVIDKGTKPTPTPTPTPVPSAPVIAQKSQKSFTITFSTDMREKLNANNLTIRNSYGISQLIESVTFSNEGKTALVKVYNTFDDRSTYTVTFDNTTLTFTTSSGDVRSIEITGVGESGNRVALGAPTKINYVLRDANGIEVDKDLNAYVEFSLVNDTYTAYVAGNEVTMWEKGKTAAIKAVYHTGEYNLTTIQEITYTSAPFTVICVESVEPELVSVSEFTISQSPDPAGANWSKKTNSISLSDSDGSYYLAAKAINTAGKTVYVSHFVSQDPSKLIIDETTGQLYPIAVGNWVVVCFDGNDRAIGSITVNVTDYRKAVSIVLDKPTVTLSNSSYVKDTAVVNVTLKDQSGKDMAIGGSSVIVTKLTPVNEWGPIADGSYGDTLTLYGEGVKAGTYQYKVSYNQISTVLRVTVSDGSGDAVSYRLSVDNATTDMKITSTTNSDRYVTLSLNGYNSRGVKVTTVKGQEITITGPDNSTFKVTTESDGTAKVVVVQGNQKKLKAGRYVASIRNQIDKRSVQPVSFQIQDTQPAPNVAFTKTQFEVYQGTYIYPEIINTLKATSNAGADRIEVSIDDSCVTGTIKHGQCDKTGIQYLAVTKVIVSEWFGNNEVKTTIALDTPRPLQITVK